MANVGIVLSGGGAKGAFQIGVLDVLLAKIKESGDKLVGIAGTSIGAMNGAFIASGQFNALKNFWLTWNMKNCPLVQSDWYGSAMSLLINGYLYNSKPLRKFFEDNLDVKKLLISDVKYINTYVRLGDGEMLLGGNIDGKNTQDRAISEIMASMALIPGTPSVNIDGVEYVDGGFRDTTPAKSLIEHCPDLDKIYVITLNPEKRQWNSNILSNTNKSLVERILFLANDILWYENTRSDIEIGKLKFWDKEMYSVIYPLKMNQDTTSFEAPKIMESYTHGISVMQRQFSRI
jgi:predicted acylesterase/phospholipase RssA